MILSDGEIQEHSAMEIPLITPFNEKQLTPNGYDLTIDKISIDDKYAEPKIDGDKKIIVVPAKKPFIILTKEWINMPAYLMGTLAIKTKYARKGIMPAFGRIDAGFKGNLNLCCSNGNDNPVEICLDVTFAQISFEQLSKVPLMLYAQRSGNYMNQDRVMK